MDKEENAPQDPVDLNEETTEETVEETVDVNGNIKYDYWSLKEKEFFKGTQKPDTAPKKVETLAPVQ